MRPCLWKKLLSWSSVAGVLFIILGFQIIISGRLRTVIVLGDAKYVLGGVSIASGLYMLLVPFMSKK